VRAFKLDSTQDKPKPPLLQDTQSRFANTERTVTCTENLDSALDFQKSAPFFDLFKACMRDGAVAQPSINAEHQLGAFNLVHARKPTVSKS
jgi:hypothetical protein